MSVLVEPRRAPLAPLRPRERRVELDPPAARPVVRLATFAALALYGSLRWASMLSPAPTGRMLALLALTVASGALLGRLAVRGRWGRALAAAGAAVALVVVFPLSGVPLALLVHHHYGTIANGIHAGLTELPRMIVPYAGANAWARTLILLGGGLLLLDAAVLLALVPAGRGDGRRAAAALPLIALAIVPYTLETPRLALLQGLLLFALVAAFVWGERLGRRQLVPAAALAAASGLVGLVLAPALDTHRPLVDYEAFANAFTPAGTETFNWFQAYGPNTWPTRGRRVLTVSATRPELWKTEGLDFFDGRGWAEATRTVSSFGSLPPPSPAPAPAVAARYTQTLRVTIAGMFTSNVVAAGSAERPENVPGGASPGASPGTWVANHQLGPGDGYLVRVYDPDPPPGALASAGSNYPAGFDYYRSMFVPELDPDLQPGNVIFPAFGSRPAPSTAAFIANAMASSPYARAYRLAQRLAAGAATPYAFVERVFRYLQHGYTYSLDAPRAAYPLEDFLFGSRIGYCQQFAGAMALLLRMGGIPARVAVGFASGTRSTTTGAWLVDDTAAHAWVEAWFPTYGWVSFDPTPPASTTTLPGGRTAAAAAAAKPRLPSKLGHDASGAGTGAHGHRGSSASLALWAVLGVLAAALVLAVPAAVARRRRRGPPSSEELLAELERALRRSSIPLPAAMTLTQLEWRFRRSNEAIGYLRALALARYAGAEELPTSVQRRALRAQLAEGRALGRLRALWALPPRW